MLMCTFNETGVVSLDRSISIAFVVVLVLESIDFHIMQWVFERDHVVHNLE